MATRKRTEIIIETERVIIMSSPTAPLWCNACSVQVEMLSPEQAAVLVHVTPRTIYRWVEAQLLHFIEEADGRLLICRNSLFGRVSERK